MSDCRCGGLLRSLQFKSAGNHRLQRSGGCRRFRKGGVFRRRPLNRTVRPMKLQVRELNILFRLRRSYSLRSFLIVVMVVAFCIGSWQRSQYLHNQAALYHLESLESGYLAVRIQRPQDPLWEQGWRKTWRWPSPLAMDRATVSKAWPLWQRSIENARKSQICLNASRMPWQFWASFSGESALPPLPTDDDDLQSWWEAQILPHVKTIGVDCAYGYGDRSVLEMQCVLQNGADQAIRRRFCGEIRSIMPVEDGHNDKAEQRVADEALGQPD